MLWMRSLLARYSRMSWSFRAARSATSSWAFSMRSSSTEITGSTKKSVLVCSAKYPRPKLVRLTWLCFSSIVKYRASSIFFISLPWSCR